MKNPFKNIPLSLDELAKWKNDPTYNPRSGCKITENEQIFKIINKILNKKWFSWSLIFILSI